MEALIDVASGSVETKIIKFANTFKGMIKTNTDGSLLADIARALGHLARASAAPNNDFVEFEVGENPEVCKLIFLPIECAVPHIARILEH